MSRGDCIVVGAGAVGLGVAYRLMRRGLSVRFLSAGRPDSSLAAAGMLAPGIETAEAALTGAAHPRLGALLHQAMRAWPDFAAELCDDPVDWRGIGYRALDTLVAGSDSDAPQLDALAGAASGFGVKRLSGGAARLLEPALTASATQALYFAGDALVEPPLLIGALIAALAAGGVALEYARVVKVTQSGAVAQLQTEHGEMLAADAIVLAAGWPGLHRLAPEFAHIIPIKGQIATLSARRQLTTMLRGPGIYLAPRLDGRVEAGATSERGVETLAVEPDAIRGLHARAAAVAPELADAWTIASRVGVRPGSPDHAPILGASALGDRVFLAAAPHRNGILLAPLLGNLIADGITSGASRGDWLDILSAARFGV